MVIIPSLPTLSIAVDINFPISSSPLEDKIAIYLIRFSSVMSEDIALNSLTTVLS